MLLNRDIVLPIDSSFLITHQFEGEMPLTGFVGCLAFLPGPFRNVM